MSPELLEWIGYIASGIVALSLLITNVWHFRWVNLVGASLFSLYGALIGSIPVALLNGLITLQKKVDGETIYRASDLKVGLFKGDTQPSVG